MASKLHIRFVRYSAFYSPLLLALEGRRLSDVGIIATYDVSKTASGEGSVDEGFRLGTVQLGQSAPALSFAPARSGVPPNYRHFALLNSHDGFFLGARDRTPGPFSWKSLEGRSVLLDHFFQPKALFFTALRKQGVDASKVHIIDAGTPAAIEAAFRAGQGDFVHLQGPGPQQLEHEGLCRVVASVGEATGPLAFSSRCATPQWLATDAAAAFWRVYVAARAEAQSLPPAEVARLVSPFLPGIALEPLTQTIAAYQRMGTWDSSIDGNAISAELYQRTVDIFLEDGYISAAPAMSDVLAAPPPS